MSTLISSTIVHSRQAWRKPSTSKPPSGRRNLTRLMEARLHAVSARNMYCEHGLLALMRPSSGQGCHSLMVVSYCTPGSAQAQAAYAISFQISAAGMVLEILPSVRRLSSQFPPLSSTSKKLLGTRIELLEFWPETVR